MLDDFFWSVATFLLRAGSRAARLYHYSAAFQRDHAVLSWAFYNGSIDYNGGLPISEATGTYSVPTFSCSCTTFTFSPFAINMVEKLWRNVCQPICF